MIEVVLKKYLDGHLNVPSFFEFEDNMPKSFVIIEKTGGSQENRLKSSVFAIQSYAPTTYEAALLNEEIKAVMDDLDTVTEVSGVRLNSDYHFPDLSLKRPRYQAVFNIYHY